MKTAHLPDNPKPTDLSPHLFWDCKQEDLDWEKHKKFIVQRVSQNGFMRDWDIMVQRYGLEAIVEVAQKLRSLDAVTVNFLATIGQVEKETFRCYTERPSVLGPWSY